MANKRTEIFFPNFSDDLFLYGYKRVTFRESNYSDVKPGDVLQAVTNNYRHPIVVVRNDFQALKTFHPGELLCDGSLSVEKAAEILTRFSKQGTVNGNTHLHALFIFHQQQFNRFSKDVRRLLLDTKGYPTSDLFDFRENRKRKENEALRVMLFQSFYYWLIEYFNTDIESYPKELADRDIISRSLINPLQKTYEIAAKSSSEKEGLRFTKAYMLAQPIKS